LDYLCNIAEISMIVKCVVCQF